MKYLLFFLVVVLSPLLSVAGPVNVNTADAETISRELTGVGLSKAQAIIDYRSANGAFKSAEDLLNVKGIGPAVLADNQGDIIVSD
jgi:competence protein ComEA